MHTIVDSLFIELGIDVSKFSKDQQTALAKIQQFESQTKRAAGNASGQIKTVGQAFRDLAKESRIGSSVVHVENLAAKFKALGVSMQASGGGAGSALGGIVMGLGAMLSPATIAAVTVGLLAKSTWDFNKSMSSANATLARNAELSGMSATNLWAMGQAAKTVGGNAEGVEASIAGLQTALAGMSIGVGSAVPQMIGMARLAQYGARFNKGGFGQGVNEETLFKAVHSMYQQQGRAKTMALVTQYGLMNQDQANLAMSANGWQEYKKAQAQAQAMKTGGGFEAVIRKSLQSQVGLGENDIAGSINAEEAYGGIQQPMQTIVGLLTDIRTFISAILNGLSSVFHWASHPKQAYDATVDAASRSIDWAKSFFGRSSETTRSGMTAAMKMLMGGGTSESDAAAMVGNMMQESAMDPLARNGSGHVGLMQWSKSRQAAFAKRFGYSMGSGSVSADQQFNDQLMFAQSELQTTQQQAANAMAKARDLLGKTSAFMKFDERPGDESLGSRFAYAQNAMRLMDAAGAGRSQVQHTVTSETHIGDIHVHTPSTDPKAHGDAVGNRLADHPFLNPAAQSTVSLATRGMTG